MTTLPIRNQPTVWLQYGSTGITPFTQRNGTIIENTIDDGISVLVTGGRAGLDLVGDDGVVTGSNIHFWDASSVVSGVPQKAQKLACNNSLFGAAPNSMYMRSTSDNGGHNHESMRWFFDGSVVDNNNGNVAALNNFGVGVASDIWIATPAVNVLSIANGTQPTSFTNIVHLYAASGDFKVMSPDGSGAQLTNNPRWTRITGPLAIGVTMDLHQNCSAQAIGDTPALIRYRGTNATAKTELSYAETHAFVLDPSDATASGRFEIWTSEAAVLAARVYVANGLMVGTPTDPGAGGIMLKPAASITPLVNGELTFEATSNTSLTIKYKGSDGTVRSNILTLA